MSKPLHVVTVCTGNTCRSPMAEVLLHAAFAQHDIAARVESIGTLGWNRRGATNHAVSAMADRELDLVDHRSRSLIDGSSSVTAADLVLAMTRIHAGAVVAHLPHLASQTFLPGEFVRLAKGAPRSPDETRSAFIGRLGSAREATRPIGRASDEISDPAGSDRLTYDRTADRLHRLMTQVSLALK